MSTVSSFFRVTGSRRMSGPMNSANSHIVDLAKTFESCDLGIVAEFGYGGFPFLVGVAIVCVAVATVVTLGFGPFS